MVNKELQKIKSTLEMNNSNVSHAHEKSCEKKPLNTRPTGCVFSLLKIDRCD